MGFSCNKLVAKLKPCYNTPMNKYNNIKKFKEADFRVVTSVTQATFNVMFGVIKEAYAQAHRMRGRHRKLLCERSFAKYVTKQTLIS
jgi:hypothetical protein